jgi:hypothetical protein
MIRLAQPGDGSKRLSMAFDYDRFDEPVRLVLHDKAAAIRDLLGSRLTVGTAEQVVQVGLRLQVVREYVGRKAFGRWVAAEFQWKRAAASKFMCSARLFRDVDCLDGFEPGALYVLSRKKVPPAARAEAIALVRAGTWVTRRIAEEIVGRYTGLAAATARLIEAARAMKKAIEQAGPPFDRRSLAALNRCAATIASALAKPRTGRRRQGEIFPGQLLRPGKARMRGAAPELAAAEPTRVPTTPRPLQ